ncbi:hypothetical protein VPHD249_0098 [Vibrio phage D249]|nr:hypothetical protein SIPHO036v1_90004 [Vibrio phage 70E38.1]QZI87997.1 hypothetical protein SIPHO041v1_p0086 [Vibrio phage 234P1]QZI89116.1 hypothetical protein SIPHO042v1_p0119 [Vibrio phage 70E37.1]
MVIPALSLHNCGNSVIKNLAVEERLELSHPFKDRLFSRQLPVDRLGLLYYNARLVSGIEPVTR